jgi:ABC-2 type transport system permease protein
MTTTMAAMRTFGAEINAESRRLLRDPMFVAPAVGFPAAFYLLFSLVLPFGPRSPEAMRLLFVNYAAFGVVGAMLFGCAIMLANDRDLGVLKLKRTTALPMPVFFGGKLVAALILAALVYLVMVLLAVAFVGVRMSPAAWLWISGSMLAGALCFGAIGMTIGAWFRTNAAPGVVNVVFLPMAALGGLWFPLNVMPGFVRTLAYGLPTFHFGELARAAAGGVTQAPWLSMLALAVTGLVAATVAHAGLRRKPF